MRLFASAVPIVLAVHCLNSSVAIADEALEVAVARMARVGSASSPTFAPDSRRVAFVSNLGGLPQAIVHWFDKYLGAR